MSLKFEEIDWMSEEAEVLANYWRRLQGSAGIPRRAEFDPAEVRSILPGIGIYKVVSPEIVYIRLAGTAMVEIFGQEITGQNFIDFWPVKLRQEAGMVLNRMVEAPCGLLVRISGETVAGTRTPGVAVGFPLRGKEDRCDMLVFHTASAVFPMVVGPRSERIKSLNVERRLFIDLKNW